MSCGVDHRCSSDPVMLWLWVTAVALIRPLAWEPAYSEGATLKKEKKKINDLMKIVKAMNYLFYFNSFI